MKTYTLYSIAAALALTLAPVAMAADASAPASVGGAASNNTVIVNIQAILHDSTAAQGMQAQMEEKSKSFQAEISKKQESLQKEEQELGKQRNVLSKSAFEDKARAFSKKVTESQKDAQSKKALLDNAYARALNDIQKQVIDIITEMAKEKNFQITVPSSQTLYYDPKLDITTDVLTRLNQKLPKVDVKFDAETPAISSDTKSKKEKK